MAAHGVEDAVHEFVVNGYAHLPRIISPETVEAMRAAWEPIRDTVVGQQNNAWQTRGQRRFTVNPIVWGSPFIRNGGEVFWEHPAVVEVLERVLGKDYACWGWGCNVPLDGSVHQRWCGSLPPHPTSLTATAPHPPTCHRQAPRWRLGGERQGRAPRDRVGHLPRHRRHGPRRDPPRHPVDPGRAGPPRPRRAACDA